MSQAATNIVSNVFENLFHSLSSGSWDAGATINDVAAAAGVSVSTVSKAVHGRYGVSPDTMRRVLEVVERARVPVEPRREQHALAPHGRDRRARAGVRAVQRRDPQGRRRAVRGTGFDLLAYSGSQDGTGEGWERRSVSRLSGTLIDGVIMVTPSVVNVSGRGADRRDRSAHRPRRPAHRRIRQLPRRAARRRATSSSSGTRASASSPGRPDLRSSVLRDAGYRSALLEAGHRVRSGARGGRPLPGGRLARARARAALARATGRRRSSPRTICRRSRCWASPPNSGSRCPTSCRSSASTTSPKPRGTSPPLSTVRQPMQRLGEVAHEAADRAHERRDARADARAPAHPARPARDHRAAALIADSQASGSGCRRVAQQLGERQLCRADQQPVLGEDSGADARGPPCWPASPARRRHPSARRDRGRPVSRGTRRARRQTGLSTFTALARAVARMRR